MWTWALFAASTLITFTLLLILVRVIGSTQLTQLTFFNWVAGAAMGNLAANMIASQTLHGWLVSCYTLVIFSLSSVAAAMIALKSRAFRRAANGEPTVLIHNGILFRENLRKCKVNLDVLMMLLREKGFFTYSDIEFAILEPTGNLSILPVKEAQSVSKMDLAKGADLSPKGGAPFVEIVVDGEIDKDKLAETGHDEDWVRQQIQNAGGKSLADVFYLAVNKQNEIVIDLHRRRKLRNPEL